MAGILDWGPDPCLISGVCRRQPRSLWEHLLGLDAGKHREAYRHEGV